MNILLADDDSKIHLIVQLWLKKNGHLVHFAQNGKQALEKLQQIPCDVLITDVNMPFVNGVELVKAALQLPEAPNLIIVMTSRCDIAQLRCEIHSQKVHLLNKPFSPKTLADLIEDFAARKVTEA